MLVDQSMTFGLSFRTYIHIVRSFCLAWHGDSDSHDLICVRSNPDKIKRLRWEQNFQDEDVQSDDGDGLRFNDPFPNLVSND